MDPLFKRVRQRLSERPARSLNLPGVSLRESAVLLPLLVRHGEPFALFTRRPEHLRSHPGQIAFPGGARDPEDPTPLHTALRELDEELGIPPDRVEVLGMLDELPTITEFRIVPFVGAIPPDLSYAPSAHEIAEIIEVPLRALLDPALHRTERWLKDGREHDVYFYDYGPHTIWGATARIVRDFLHKAKDAFEPGAEVGKARPGDDEPKEG